MDAALIVKTALPFDMANSLPWYSPVSNEGTVTTVLIVLSRPLTPPLCREQTAKQFVSRNQRLVSFRHTDRPSKRQRVAQRCHAFPPEGHRLVRDPRQDRCGSSPRSSRLPPCLANRKPFSPP